MNKQLFLNANIAVASVFLSASVFATFTGPHGHVTISGTENSGSKGGTVTKTLKTPKGTYTTTTYRGPAQGGYGVVKTKTVTGPEGKEVNKTTQIYNSTGTGDGAANGAESVTKSETISSGDKSETTYTTKSK
ncbi:MAG: hypothetical protein FJ390_07560 [Verrucomicrobia bacterium]|nr:hypothetical protein [Verrucomicrobiota bacterium]